MPAASGWRLLLVEQLHDAGGLVGRNVWHLEALLGSHLGGFGVLMRLLVVAEHLQFSRLRLETGAILPILLLAEIKADDRLADGRDDRLDGALLLLARQLAAAVILVQRVGSRL